jgi:hypothetical protein
MINRNFISPNEGRLTILQFIGFCLLVLGVSGMITASVLDAGGYFGPEKISSVISIGFFISMLGFAFAFPSLLEGNEGLSTMRIIVFMVTNVICMLLLKIGWPAAKLEDIGLDQYWVGVIAFVFGAKAVQSFFESGMARLSGRTKLSNEDIARHCVAQNDADLKHKFPNIMTVSDSVRNIGNVQEPIVILYLSDNNTEGLPSHLPVRLPDGTTKVLSTELVPDNDDGSVHFCQKDPVDSNDNKGSICCMVSKTVMRKRIRMGVTAGHVYTGGDHTSFDGELTGSQQTILSINGDRSGKWFMQLIDHKNDIGIFTIEEGEPNAEMISFKSAGHYEVKSTDVGTTQVKLISAASPQKIRQGYILDFNLGWDVPYRNGKFTVNNIVLIGDNPVRKNSKSLSIEGDSGGLVYEPQSGKFVGLILGGNNRFTWVLPIKQVLNDFHFSLE